MLALARQPALHAAAAQSVDSCFHCLDDVIIAGSAQHVARARDLAAESCRAGLQLEPGKPLLVVKPDAASHVDMLRRWPLSLIFVRVVVLPRQNSFPNDLITSLLAAENGELIYLALVRSTKYIYPH